MSYCNTCGAALASGARFCTACGSTVAAPTVPTSPPPGPPPPGAWFPPPVPPPKKPVPIGGIIAGVVAGVVALGLVAVGIARIANDRAEPEASDAPSTTVTSGMAGQDARARLDSVQCNDTTPPPGPARPTFTAPPPMTVDPARKYTAMFVTSCGTITIELDPSAAPKTVNNFVFLARQQYFDGLTFHRVVRDFVIQGGDPTGTGSGGPGYQFDDELSPDGYRIGSLAMANAGPNTNGSQFFIVTGDDGVTLPSKYSRFGMVTSGIEVAQKLESFAQPADPRGTPSRTLYIFSVTITEG